MPDIGILLEMIKSDARLEVVKLNGKNQVTLIEPQNDKGNVVVFGLPDDIVVIKADRFKSPDAVFCGSKGECKRADFVIVANTGNKRVILCIEMKARRDSEKEIVQQLAGTRCFMTYCQEIGRTFWRQQDFLSGYAYRFISIGQISIDKKKTRMTRLGGLHDQPERMLKIAWPHHLQFNQLAGGS
jgi:hypothetical protein